jgi:plastocyanin
MRKFLLFWVGLCLVAAVAACGGSGTATEEQDAGTATLTASPTETDEAATETATAPPAAGAPTITMADMSFGEPITVSPGAQITVINNDSVEHSVTSRDEGKFDVHVDGNQQATLTAPTEPGEYQIYCIYHPSMTGTLIVA